MALSIDPALVTAARSDDVSLELLIVAVWPEAYRLAASILRDRTLAEDVAQEACATMARSLDGLKDVKTFSPWFYRIVSNYAIGAARRRRPTVSIDAVSECSTQFDSSDALDLYDALAALPIDQRAALVLHYYAGLNSFDIAAVLGVAAPTVRFRIMLARRALAKALSQPSSTSDEVLSHVR
ncbi:MAG TPA: RNA polymerase sigma factor [Candidatus Baltobacteraceae bacterium]|nr:RNA polymerase sigma factor [Candidatus Baltobacteraceae bacterium]